MAKLGQTEGLVWANGGQVWANGGQVGANGGQVGANGGQVGANAVLLGANRGQLIGFGYHFLASEGHLGTSRG